MAQIETSCTQCGGIEFEDGFVEDRGQGSQGYTRWVEGVLEMGIFGSARLLGKPRRAVVAQRCAHCGHLELYATDHV